MLRKNGEGTNRFGVYRMSKGTRMPEMAEVFLPDILGNAKGMVCGHNARYAGAGSRLKRSFAPAG